MATLRLLQFFFLTLPLQFALSPAEGIDLHLSRLGIIVIFVVWAIEFALHKHLSLPNTASLLCFLSFLFVAASSILWADEVGWALRKVIFLISFSILMFPLFGVVRRYGPVVYRAIVTPLIIGGVLVAGCGIVQSLSQMLFGVETVYQWWITYVLPVFLGHTFAASVAAYPSLLVNIGGMTIVRASATFPDPHMFAYYMGMLIPLAGVWGVVSSRPRDKGLFFGAALVLLIADLLTFSRGGYAGLLASLLLGVFLFRERIFSSPRRKILALGAATLSLGFLFIPSSFQSRFLSSFSQQDGSATARMSIWHDAALSLQKEPLFGYGIGNYPLVVNPLAQYRDPIYAHNLFLDVALETGILGMSVFLASLVLACVSLVSIKKPFAYAIFFSFAVYIGHSMFETPLYSVQVLPLLLLLLVFADTTLYE